MEVLKKLVGASGGGEVLYVGGASAGTVFDESPLTVNLSGIDIQSGDIIVYVFANGSHTTWYPSTPSGYTALPTIFSSSSDRNCNTASGYKIADGTETSLSITTTYGVGAIVKVFRGVDPSNPFDVARTTATGPSNAYPNPPSNTSVTDGCMAVVIAGTYTHVDTSEPVTLYELSSSDLDEFVTQEGNGLYNCIVGMGVKHMYQPSSFDPSVFGNTKSSDADTNWGSATMILKPL